MKQRLVALQHHNLKRPVWWALFCVAVAARLLIAACGRAFLLPQGSGLDDMLMVRAAQSLVEGQWLGPYTFVAIAKNMGFAFWLAGLHLLHIPVLLGNAALWVCACIFAMWALRPALPGNLARLVVFCFFAFQPVSFAFFTLRIYRDAIYPALCLFFFAGFVGFALRLKQKRLLASLGCMLGGGLGLAGAWLTREEGAVLLLFAVCAAAATLLAMVVCAGVGGRPARVLCCLLPFGLLAAGIGGVSAGNQRHYGAFLVSDMAGGSFPAAYGALAAVSEGESGFHPGVPVTVEALERLYAEVPAMAQLRPYLQEGPAYNGYFNPDTGQYVGSFYFALRFAAEQAGFTPNAAAAQAFWARLHSEVQTAVAEGRLRSAAPHATTVPRWNAALLVPTLGEVGRSACALLLYRDCDPRPQFSIGQQPDIDETAAWLRVPVQVGYDEGTDQPYYNVIQRAAFAVCDGLIWVYRLLTIPLLAAGVLRMVGGLAAALAALRRRTEGAGPRLLGWVLVLGLLLSLAARLAVAAYMEVAAFGIGTYLMYLSAGMPPLLLFCVLALALPRRFGPRGTQTALQPAHTAFAGENPVAPVRTP